MSYVNVVCNNEYVCKCTLSCNKTEAREAQGVGLLIGRANSRRAYMNKWPRSARAALLYASAARSKDERSDRYGGTAVLIRNHIPIPPVGIPAHGYDLQAVSVKVEDTTFLSLYIASPFL
ncbi:hypothetical protein EVAR_54399_1 [Eumeta japonica]|uniref:Uncharacterized protein n=1 Tax=Eumeta variegata TaxID=151549 RepID=A0A4C1Y7P4_EUMVA|nr:hypothetical protein EVAR_54399_1 [Eumeta japonica]